MSSPSIYQGADGVFRGPFTHAAPLREGETARELSVDEYSQLCAVRAESPGAPLVFMDGVFSLSPGEVVRLALVGDLEAQEVGVQLFFKPIADTVRDALRAGDIASAREIIATLPIKAALEPVRETMLSRFPND